ncbi:MAG: hypothetical protein H6714_10105 [Myxococcales bacterium]|nr:hypothetical protein [Myxococcales bacterium]
MRYLQTLFLGTGMMFGAAASLGACADEVEEAIDCNDICTTIEDCGNEDFDVDDCVDHCEDQPNDEIDTCDSCLDDNDTCTECTADCAPLLI